MNFTLTYREINSNQRKCPPIPQQQQQKIKC